MGKLVSYIDIPAADNVEDLRQYLVYSLNILVAEINRIEEVITNSGKRLINLGEPINPTDAATKAYVDRIFNQQKVAPRAKTLYNNIGVFYQDVTLTANTTITPEYTATPGSILTIVVTQGAGPYTVAFSSHFAPTVPTNIPAVAGYRTCYVFTGRPDGLWHIISIPAVIEP